MRTLTALLLVLLSSLQSILAGDKPQDKVLAARHFQQTITQDVSADYTLFLPRDYETKPGERWPLLLFLHGAGERGTNVWQTDIHGPAKYILDHPEFPFILVSPLCASNETWSNAKTAAAAGARRGNAAGRFPPDLPHRNQHGRVWLLEPAAGAAGEICRGHSASAAAPMPSPSSWRAWATPPREKVQALKTLPIWAFHGGRDEAVPPDESRRAVEALKQCGVTDIKLTIYPEAQHDCWTQTYRNPEIYAWLLTHHR